MSLSFVIVIVIIVSSLLIVLFFFGSMSCRELFVDRPCDSIVAAAFSTTPSYPPSYTGRYDQLVVFTLPGADNRNLIMRSDGTPGFSTNRSHAFVLEYVGPNPDYTIMDRQSGVVYLTDYFRIKDPTSGAYVTKAADSYRFTMTAEASVATTFYLFQKHSMYYNHDAGGMTLAEKNSIDDSLRYLHALVTNKNGPDQDLENNGWQWKTDSPDFDHFVCNSQSQWNTFTWTLS